MRLACKAATFPAQRSLRAPAWTPRACRLVVTEVREVPTKTAFEKLFLSACDVVFETRTTRSTVARGSKVFAMLDGGAQVGRTLCASAGPISVTRTSTAASGPSTTQESVTQSAHHAVPTLASASGCPMRTTVDMKGQAQSRRHPTCSWPPHLRRTCSWVSHS